MRSINIAISAALNALHVQQYACFAGDDLNHSRIGQPMWQELWISAASTLVHPVVLVRHGRGVDHPHTLRAVTPLQCPECKSPVA